MDSLATRYASGLLKVAQGENDIASYKNGLIQLDRLFEDDAEVRAFLQSTFVLKEDKEALLDRLIEGAPMLQNFLKLLVAKKRFIYFHPIKKEFVRLANEALGIKEGTVYSSIPINGAQLEAMEATLTKKIGVPVELHNEIDKTLLGGFKIIVQGQVYDYTLNDKLEKLGQRMLERGDHRAH
ncbi:MAG: ATP synthase F1 subunit delta [Bacilli bacterium]|jgi:F-type H+-transporting ATPase subunit delta